MRVGGTGPCAAERTAVVVNGNAKRVTEDLVEVLDQIIQSGDLFVSRSLDEGCQIARVIVDRGYHTVLTGGGDGTFAKMVTWVCEEAERASRPPPRFGLLRLGTGNALAWLLGAQNPQGRGVIADLGRLRKEGGSRPLRLLEVQGTLTPFAGLGADAIALAHFTAIKEAMQRTPGLRRFATGGVAHFLAIAGRTAPESLLRKVARVRIVNEGEDAQRLGVDGQPIGAPIPRGEVVYYGPAVLVAMSTIPYWGFGARMFPFAEDREDRFNLRIVNVNAIEMATHVRQIWKGTYRHGKLHDFLVDQVRIEYEAPMPLQVGGDVAGSHRVVSARLSPRPIQVVDYYAPPPVD